MRRRALSLAVSSTLHLIAVVLIAVATPAPPRVVRAPAGDRPMSVFVVPRDDDSGPPGLRPLDPNDADDLPPPHGSSSVSVPGFAFDAAKIDSRAPLLFPFLTPGLSLGR